MTEAADRILSLRPADIRKLDDASTAKLIEDLIEIGFRPALLAKSALPPEARGFLSSIRVWGQALQMAGDSDDAPQPKPKRERPEPPAPPITRTERARQLDRKITIGITATEANDFLRSLPPYGETSK